MIVTGQPAQAVYARDRDRRPFCRTRAVVLWDADENGPFGYVADGAVVRADSLWGFLGYADLGKLDAKWERVARRWLDANA